MNTNGPGLATERFLASPDMIAGLLADLAHPRPRKPRARAVPDWLDEILKAAPPVPVARPSRVCKPVPAPKPTSPFRARTAMLDRRKRCHCGQCTLCLDNARWNRIFNEKFADPSYYGRIILRHDSTLAGARNL